MAAMLLVISTGCGETTDAAKNEDKAAKPAAEATKPPAPEPAGASGPVAEKAPAPEAVEPEPAVAPSENSEIGGMTAEELRSLEGEFKAAAETAITPENAVAEADKLASEIAQDLD